MDTDYFEFLKSCFDEWNTQNPEKNTIRGLARLTGIGKNVVYNMANGIPRQSKYSFQDTSQYLKMTQVEKNVYLEFMKEHHQDFISLAEQFMADRESAFYSNMQLSEILRMPLAYEIFQVCITKRGATRSEIKNRYGQDGVEIVDLFVNNEILSEKNGWIRHSYSENVIFDDSLTNRLIKHNVENFDIKKLGNKKVGQRILVRSVSKETLVQVLKIYNEAAEKINQISFLESDDEEAVILKINFLVDSHQF